MSFVRVKQYATLALFSLVIWSVSGQKARGPMVQVQKFSVEQGLSDRNINVFAKDRQGFLWIGTFNGLNRFDGYNFLNYDARPRNRHKIRHTKIYALLTDRAGHLLICYEEAENGAIDRLDPLTGQITPFTFDLEQGFQGKHFSYFQAADGAIYFLAIQEGRMVVYGFDEKTSTFSNVLEGPNSSITRDCSASFLKAADGTFWFGYGCGNTVELTHTDTGGRILQVYGRDDFDLKPDIRAGLTALEEDAGGKILFTLEKQGVYLVDPSGSPAIIRHPLLPPEGYFFAKDKKGNMLAYQTQPADPARGCYLISATGQVLNYSWIFDHQTIIDQVFSEDFSQGLMAGSGDGFNIFQLRPERFKTFLDKDLGGKPYGISIRGMAKLERDNLYIATERDGLYDLNMNTGVLTRTGDRSPQLELLNRFQFPKHLLAQGDSILWLTGVGGVLKFEPTQNSLQFFKTNTRERQTGTDEIWGIGSGKNGTIWVLARDGRLLQLNPRTNELTLYRNKDGSQPFERTQPSFLCCARDGTMWVGTTGAGLIGIDAQKKESRHFTANPEDPSGFNSNHVTCIHEDDAGLLWVGTMESGLHVFDPRTGKVRAIYSRENGLLNNSIAGILPDDKGNYWVSTYIGLSYFDTKLKTFRNYTTVDGLSFNEFNRFSYFFDKDHGRYYFGGMNGVNAFDQKDPQPGANDAPLLISEISLSNQNGEVKVQQEGIVDGSTVALEPGSRFLRLRLALGTFYNPTGNQFSYKIDGLDEDWNYLGVNRDLRLDYLPTGEYTLHLRGADSRGNWSSREIALRLVVQQFWYKRWWAFLLYAALVAAGGWFFYRFQLRRRIAEKEAQRLQQLDTFKTRFFTNISHEFRTPLTVILGMVESLKKHFEKGAGPEHEQAAELIRRNSRHVLNLVNQLLDLARLESGKLRLSPANGDIAAFLQYQLESFQSYAETRRIALHFHSDRPHLEMAFDHEKIQAVLVNLISNAIKFTPEGGRIDLRLTLDEGKLPGSAPGGNFKSSVVIQVSDTGIGIPEEQLDRIFDRFYQVDDSMTRKGEGTGIGLALVQELVKLMQGTVSVESRPGSGTSFRITLPHTPPLPQLQPFSGSLVAEETLLQSDTPATSGTADDDQRPLLLIAEDNPDVRFYIAECVKTEYRVTTASNGAEGIRKAVTLVPDIIISDVMMPEKDGFELCETLKSDPVTSHIPIVLLTARADFESRIAGLKRGADDYLAKPFEPVELRIRLENLVKIRRRLQERYAAMTFEPEASDDPALVLEDAFLLKIRDVVEARISETDFDMPQLEQALGMSRSQVFRKVKALTGASPSVLIRNIRLNKALELLGDNSLTIAEIAYEVGFSTPAYFSTMFLEAFGKTPSEWRQG